MLSDTNYELKTYSQGNFFILSYLMIEGGQTNNQGDALQTITTTSRGTVSGVLTFWFMTPVFSGVKQRLLCWLSTHYSIPFEDLWTDDLINCEQSMMGQYAKTWHTANEYLINKTVGNIFCQKI